MDRDFLIELFASFGAIDIKRMFGGMSLSTDGIAFALVSRDIVYLKADDETIPRFESEGCTPFQYEMRGVVKTMASYWRLPERLYDDPDETAMWARAAHDAARRAALKKVTKPRPSVPTKADERKARTVRKKRAR